MTGRRQPSSLSVFLSVVVQSRSMSPSGNSDNSSGGGDVFNAGISNAIVGGRGNVNFLINFASEPGAFDNTIDQPRDADSMFCCSSAR